MDTHRSARLVLAPTTGPRPGVGAWWPRSRHLATELVSLFEAWPPEAGLLSRVYYCPLDWDDAPVAVSVPRRRGRLRLGHLPAQDERHVVLGMLDGARRTLVVVPSSTPAQAGELYLEAFGRHPDEAPPPAGDGPRHP